MCCRQSIEGNVQWAWSAELLAVLVGLSPTFETATTDR
jgi:hypothetical protein